jgi:hypothetical protein
LVVYPLLRSRDDAPDCTTFGPPTFRIGYESVPKFLEGFADKLKVPVGARDVLVFDSEVAGFGIRKFASGKAYCIIKYSVAGKTRRQSLGEVTRGNLKPMRMLASELKARAGLGQDIVAERRAAETKRAKTLARLVPRYLALRPSGDECVPKLRPKSIAEVTHYLERSLKPLHGLAINAITRTRVEPAVKGLALSNGRMAADRARAALSGLFAWAIRERNVDSDPTLGIRPWSQNALPTRLTRAPTPPLERRRRRAASRPQ